MNFQTIITILDLFLLQVNTDNSSNNIKNVQRTITHYYFLFQVKNENSNNNYKDLLKTITQSFWVRV